MNDCFAQRDIIQRVAAFLDRLAAERMSTKETSGQTILVAHGGSVINIIAWWLRLDVEMLARVSFLAIPRATRKRLCMSSMVERQNWPLTSLSG